MRRALLLAFLAVACDADPERDDAARAAAPPPSQHFDVDSSAYTLRRDGEGWTASIGYVYRNPTDDTLHVVNCNGAIVMDLQQRMGSDWRTVWYGMSNGCLSPGLEILPNDSMTGRLVVWGAEIGHANLPTFETYDFDGEFRLIWHHLRAHYDVDAANLGDTLTVEQRTSEPFQLAQPSVHGVVHHRFDWAEAERAMDVGRTIAYQGVCT